MMLLVGMTLILSLEYHWGVAWQWCWFDHWGDVLCAGLSEGLWEVQWLGF